MLSVFNNFTVASYIFGAISLIVAIYITYITMKNNPQPLKKYVVLAIISFVFFIAMFGAMSPSQPKRQIEIKKSVTELYVVVDVHKDYIRVVGLDDNKPLDLETEKLASSDYYVNDIIDDAGNIQIFGQALEKAQAQIPSIGTAVSSPSS